MAYGADQHCIFSFIKTVERYIPRLTKRNNEFPNEGIAASTDQRMMLQNLNGALN